jgi:hypothetical protein
MWLVIQHSHGKSPFLIGKTTINGPFSMAMLNNQRVSAKDGHSTGLSSEIFFADINKASNSRPVLGYLVQSAAEMCPDLILNGINNGAVFKITVG